MPGSSDVRIGLSGWNYPGWRGRFYPKGLPHRRELEYAAHQFRTIEINGTFYRAQRPEHFAQWADQTPDDFAFAVKGPRYITHMLRLKDSGTALANFFATGVLRLGPKLGPILWQFPPQFHFHPERIEPFLRTLPRDTEAAVRLACRHDSRFSGRVWLRTDARRKLRHAFEIRHDSFRSADFIALLRRYGVALVCADTVDWPLLMDVTADFIYCRLHGSEELYASGYDDAALDAWAHRVAAWARGGEPEDTQRIAGKARRRTRRDVFVYFDNDAKVRAPQDAQGLAQRVAALIGGQATIPRVRLPAP